MSAIGAKADLRLLLKKDLHDGRNLSGFSVSNPATITPLTDYPLGWHGTRVARLFASISGLSVSELVGLVRINVVNVVRLPAYEIDPGGLIDAIGYALQTGAEVANVSIGSESSALSLLPSSIGERSLILVVAAENERHQLGEEGYRLYPALYGGENKVLGTRVITVAGYDGALGLAQFSNWSEHFADIMAPACALSVGSMEGDSVDGTSFAAPMVSLTAAIIRSFEQDVLYTKARLQASVDYEPTDHPRVLWRGRLNIAKALSLYEDVIEDRASHKLSYGEWIPDLDDESGQVELCANAPAYDPDVITKIISLQDSEPYSIMMQHRAAPGLLVMDPPCQPKQAGLKFFNAYTKTLDVVHWKDFSDFVMRHFSASSPSKEAPQLETLKPQ